MPVNWIFSKEELENSPSRREKMKFEEEMKFRKCGIQLIQELGKRLKLPQYVVATAAVFYHRYYSMYPFSVFKGEYLRMATTCVFLAGKVDDHPRKLTAVIPEAYKLIKCREMAVPPSSSSSSSSPPQAPVETPEFDEWRSMVLDMEASVLHTLAFDLKVDHSYSFVLTYSRAITSDKETSKQLGQLGWSFVNDSLRTTLCLQFKPQEIAAASLCLAAQVLKKRGVAYTLPSNYHDLMEIRFEHLQVITNQILELYPQGGALRQPGQSAAPPPSSSAPSTPNPSQSAETPSPSQNSPPRQYNRPPSMPSTPSQNRAPSPVMSSSSYSVPPQGAVPVPGAALVGVPLPGSNNGLLPTPPLSQQPEQQQEQQRPDDRQQQDH